MTNVESAVCEMVNSLQMVLGSIMMLCVVGGIFSLALGIILYVTDNKKKKTWKTKAGIAIVVITIVAPFLAGFLYLLVPLIVNALTGMDVANSC